MTNKEVIEQLLAIKKLGFLTDKYRQALNIAIKTLEESSQCNFVARPTEVVKIGEPLSNSEDISMAFEKGKIYKRGFEDARKRYERPKGEWAGNYFNEHTCNKCGHYALYEEESDGQYYEVESNFCPECGADMRKGDRK